MSVGDRIDCLAALVRLIGQVSKLSYLLERKAEIAGVPDKPKPTEMVMTVTALISARARRSR